MMRVAFYMCGGEQSHYYSDVPLGIGYLMANAPKGTHMRLAATPGELVDCDLVALSSDATGLKEAVSIVEASDVPVIIGGQGTLWPGLTEYNFAHIVRGEGEVAFCKIVNGTKLPQVVREPNVPEIDTINPPVLGRLKSKLVPVMSSRGCPFSCRFCSSQKFWGGVRFHSAGYVMDEIFRRLVEYPQVNEIYFLDDLFIAHRSRFEIIYKSWMDAGLHKRLKLRGFVRADVLTHEVLVKLKKMGMHKIRFGAESGSNRILKMLGKGQTVEQYWTVVNWCRELDMGCTASFMHNIPGETVEDVAATKKFISDSGIGKAGWYKFAAFPGTDMWNGESPLEIDMTVRPA